MSSMEAKIEILWNSLLLTWSYDYRIAGIHTFDKDGLAIGVNLIERLNLETSWGTLTILETTDTSITFIHNGTRIILSDGAKYHFEVPQVLTGSQGDFYIELICSQVRLTHWDEFFECSRQFTVDKIDWDLMQDGDVDSALLIAESIAEQSPESLEIIAEYMAVADNLGSKEAHEWLRDYYSTSDIAETYSKPKKKHYDRFLQRTQDLT